MLYCLDTNAVSDILGNKYNVEANTQKVLAVKKIASQFAL